MRGPADAWITIVEFADFECVYCGEAEATIAEVDRSRSGLRWVFKYFPLTSIHPHALGAAMAAECANEQGKFWEMHKTLFANQVKLDAASIRTYAASLGLDLAAYDVCLASSEPFERIKSDFALGIDAGLLGTPAFFINGRLLPGAYPAQDFFEVIDAATEAAKQSGIAQTDYYHQLEVSNGCADG